MAHAPPEENDTRRKLFERVSPAICTVSGTNHACILVATYEIEHNPHIVKCDECHVRRLVLYFDPNDLDEYEVFKKQQRWSSSDVD